MGRTRRRNYYHGERLTAIPHYNKIFWCVWADFFPHTAVHGAATDVALPPAVVAHAGA